MIRLFEYASVKTTLLVISGIIIGKFLLLPSELLFITSLLLTAGIFWGYRNKINPLSQGSLFLLLIVTGVMLYQGSTLNKHSAPLPDNIQRHITVTGTVENVGLEREEVQFILETDYYVIADSILRHSEKILIHIRDEEEKELRDLLQTLDPGDRITISGTRMLPSGSSIPGGFDYREYLNSLGITALFYAFDTEAFTPLKDSPVFPGALMNTIRQTIAGRLDALHNENTAAILRALLLADRSLLSQDRKEAYINAGVMHVLAVSGLHVGMIILIFTVLFQRFSFKFRLAAISAGILIFMLLTGSPPSVFRASVMAIVYLTALYTNRDANKFNALALAALIILLFNPADLFTAGFQLSFAAVGGILIGLEWFYKFDIKNKIRERILLFLVVSLSAQLATLPLTAYYFGKISITALPAGIIAIPAAGALLGNGILTLFLSLFSFAAAGITASAGEFILLILSSIIDYTALLPFAFLATPLINITQVLVYYGIFILLIAAFTVVRSRYSGVLLFSLGILLLFTGWHAAETVFIREGELTAVFIDVDQGDAAMLILPDGKAVLIDAGPVSGKYDSGSDVIIPLMRKLGIGSFETVFLSHTDIDHYGGIFSLMEAGYVKTIMKPHLDSANNDDLMLESIIHKYRIPLHYYTDTCRLTSNTAFFSLVDTGDRIYDYFSDNDGSGVLKIIYGNTSILFTGDIQGVGENLLLQKYNSFLNSDILKVSHHGSAGSSSSHFLAAVQPEAAVISAGAYNWLGHPAAETLERLQKRDCSVYRTDLEGTVILQSDGIRWKKIEWN